MTGLDALERRYLRAGADLPIHREDSGWEPLIDGERYLPALDAEIRAAGPGDAVYLSAFQLGPDTDLRGRAADDPDFEPVAELLSRKAAEGVDVRLIIAGGAPGSLPVRGLGPFRDNLVAVRRLRRWTPAGLRRRHHPLARRILLDWSGHPIGANHQKFVVVRRGDAVVAFVGGMDIDRWRFDGEPHDRLRVSGRRWGWHDAAQRVTGAAAERVWEVFRARWQEATSLPRRLYWLPPDRPRLVNPRTHLPAPEAAPAGEPRPTAGKSLQVARSFGPWKRALGLSLLPRRWRVLPATGVSEIFDVLTHAVDAADRYVYVEDQYFREFPGAKREFSPFPAVRRALERGVKVILVTSGVENNAGKEPANRTLNSEVRRQLLEPLGPAERRNLALYRVEHLTVHSKIVLIDDVFACIGSANFFSRSMSGVDHELSVATVDAGHDVRDLRVRLWAEHLRADLDSDGVRDWLADLDNALGVWRPEWGGDDDTGPLAAASTEDVLNLVGPA